ncbi:MAG: hypothetical protein ACJA0N_000558 [Pseudohongiellaceae bacterium]|jgi:hypothetical protein
MPTSKTRRFAPLLLPVIITACNKFDDLSVILRTDLVNMPLPVTPKVVSYNAIGLLSSKPKHESNQQLLYRLPAMQCHKHHG